jgi:hypothetical protein
VLGGDPDPVVEPMGVPVVPLVGAVGADPAEDAVLVDVAAPLVVVVAFGVHAAVLVSAVTIVCTTEAGLWQLGAFGLATVGSPLAGVPVAALVAVDG